jgi:hypothetical protein
MDTYRVRPLALTEGHRSQKRVRSTAEAAPWSFTQYRNLILTITLLSVTAMVALGVGLGTVIGFERRPVPKRQAAYKDEMWRIVVHVAKPPQLSPKIERSP